MEESTGKDDKENFFSGESVLTQSFLEKLSERCPDGFVLIGFDFEGNPFIDQKFRTPAQKMALDRASEIYVESVVGRASSY